MRAAIPHVSVHFIQFSRFVSLLSSRLVHFSSILLVFLFFAAFSVSLFLALVAFLSCHSVASLHSNPFIEPGFFNIQVCEYVHNISIRIITYLYVPSSSFIFPHKTYHPKLTFASSQRHRSFTTSLVSPTCFAPLAPLTAAFSLAELMLKESSPSDQGASTLVFDAPKSQRHGHHILNRGKNCRSSYKIYKSV